MDRRVLIAIFSFFTAVFVSQSICAKTILPDSIQRADSVSTRKQLVVIVNKVIEASGSFDIGAVGDLYTPNALVADEQPPFSWNGPTAGAQWIGSIEKTCKDLKIKHLKGRMGRINVYLQTGESVYLVVPATYSGDAHGGSFEESGAFTFVFRLVNDRWLIKSQVWMPRKGL
jgi:ketosteroid isomerase-like protein